MNNNNFSDAQAIQCSCTILSKTCWLIHSCHTNVMKLPVNPHGCWGQFLRHCLLVTIVLPKKSPGNENLCCRDYLGSILTNYSQSYSQHLWIDFCP
jgi:hypothetical protein